MTDNRAIESLWYESGTAWDFADAENLHRSAEDKITGRQILKIWKRAKAEGRLPPFVRPKNGYAPNQSTVLKRFMMVGSAKAA